jgi:uncharacterized membrane protein
VGATSERRAAFAFAIWSRSAVDELETFLLVAGVVLIAAGPFWAGEGVVAAVFPGGDIA